MTGLVGVDWGTSSLRAARLAPDGAVLEERASPRGILTVPAGGFRAVLEALCGEWLAPSHGVCLVSGMAGSRQGWQEAPYCPCPAGEPELARALTWIEPGRIAIVPGLCCEHGGVPDVLRGEEVQVYGAMDLLGRDHGTFVLPGTHSKWVRAEGGQVRGFTTWMSGEVYALLRQHSILARTLPEGEDDPLVASAFLQGVRQAQEAGSLLASAFGVRALSLFDRLPIGERASYLSGLVIGEELRAQHGAASDVVLIGSPALAGRYALALDALGVRCVVLGAAATWRGQWRLAQSLEPAK